VFCRAIPKRDRSRRSFRNIWSGRKKVGTLQQGPLNVYTTIPSATLATELLRSFLMARTDRLVRVQQFRQNARANQ
jgi:hypothetical protein